MCQYHRDAEPTRRRMLALAGASAGTLLAGCLGDSSPAEAPDPIALEGGLQCDVCGMVIGEHFGPNGQLFYEDFEPGGHENPARFDALEACLFPYLFQQDQQGRSPIAAYATDYSAVEYTLETIDEQTYISTHTTADSFAPAETLNYVVDSSLQGAMGPDFFPFGDRADAEDVAGEFGGRVIGFEKISTDLLGQ